MKKTIKSLCDFMEKNREFIAEQKEKELQALVEKTPAVALLTCPYPLRFLGNSENYYVISSYGSTLWGNEATLDYALKVKEIPLLLIMVHEDCSALQGALKGEGNTSAEKALFSNIAPAFIKGKARKFRDNVMKHLDYQTSVVLERYRELVKADRLIVVGIYASARGEMLIANYNGLRGLESLTQALPDVNPDFFLS